MEHHNPNEPSLIINIAGFICQIMFFIHADLTADEFRAWTSWLMGVTVSLLLIVINFPKAVEAIKNIFKK